MDGYAGELVKILEGEIDLHGNLLEIAAREKEAMKIYSLDEMLACQKVRKNLNLQLKSALESRLRVMNEISAKMELPPGAVTLSGISELVGGGVSERLERCRKALKDTAEKLSSVHRDSEEVARGALSFIDRSIRVLSKNDLAPPTYLSSGEVRGDMEGSVRVARQA